jgi:hypothetical protein
MQLRMAMVTAQVERTAIMAIKLKPPVIMATVTTKATKKTQTKEEMGETSRDRTPTNKEKIPVRIREVRPRRAPGRARRMKSWS